MLPLFQSPGISHDCHDFSNTMKSGFVTTSANSLRTPGCISSCPMDLCISSSGGPDQIFIYSGSNFVPSVPILLSTHSRAVGRKVAIEDWGKKLLSTSAFSSPFLPVCQHCLSGRVHLGLSHPIARQQNFITMPFPAHCPCFHCLCIWFIPFSLTTSSLLSHAGLLPSWLDLLSLGIASSCALWKTSLEICQLCSTPLSLSQDSPLLSLWRAGSELS